MSNIDFTQAITAADKAEQEQAARAAGVNAERDRRLAAGATVTITGYGDVPLQGRPSDQINLIALGDTARDLAAASITDPVIPFRDATNTMHNLTALQVQEMARKGKAAASAIYAAAWALKDSGDIPADYADDGYWP